MNFAMIVYLIGILAPLNNMLVFIFVSCFIAVVGLAIVCLVAEDEFNRKKGWGDGPDESGLQWYRSSFRWLKTCVLLCSVCGILTVFIPSKETAYVMVAAYGVEGIVTDDRVQQLGGKSLDVIEKWLDDMSTDRSGKHE